MADKVKSAWGALIAVVVLMFCACIAGLIIGSALAANIWLWHWIISAMF
ncbi:hypothetical protein [Limosilactobacillus reuteri]|nr:hypothetical protein [Limosilactobacillus reuteri]